MSFRKTPNIPKFLYKATEDGDVIDSFLKHFTLEISHFLKDLTKKAISMENSNRKDIAILSKSIISELSCFPPLNETINSSVLTFSSISETNVMKSIEKIDLFYPAILGNGKIIEPNHESILDFFPQITSETSPLACFVGFVSEAMYTLLLTALLESESKENSEIYGCIINRFLSRSSYPTPGTFAFQIMCLIEDCYKPIIRYICKVNFATFAKIFVALFPKPTTKVYQAISFFHSALGICFNEEEYKVIEKPISTIPNLIKTYKNSNDFAHALCLFLSKAMPQYHLINFKDITFYTKFATSYIKNPVAWESSLRFLGVLHYIQTPDLESKQYLEFFNKKVVLRLKKPHKIHAALEYIIAFLRPSRLVPANPSKKVYDFVESFFPTLLAADLSQQEDRVAHIFEIMATLNITKFIDEWIPKILSPSSQIKGIGFIAVGKILNPLSGFFEDKKMKKLLATNQETQRVQMILSDKERNEIREKLILKVESLLPKIIPERSQNTPKYSFDFIPAAEILASITIKSSTADLNKSSIPTNILLFLLSYSNYIPIRKLPRIQVEDLLAADAITKDSLKQWSATFETPIEYFGSFLATTKDLFNDAELESEISNTKTTPKEIHLLQILPLIMYRSDDIENYINIIFDMIICDNPRISAFASIIFELMFFALPSMATSFLIALAQVISVIKDKTSQQQHQLILTFYHCIKYAGHMFKDDEVSIINMCDTVAFFALCSPYRETRQIGFDIIDASEMFLNINETKKHKEELCLFTFFNEHSASIEQRIILTVISNFTSVNAQNCPIYRLPSIPFRTAALSPYLILWKFSLKELANELLDNQMHYVVSFIRKILISSVDFVCKEEEILKLLNKSNINDVHYFSNVIGFLFSTADTMPAIPDMFQRNKWNEQIQYIKTLFHDLVTACMVMDDKSLPAISFIFISIHAVLLQDAFDIFFKSLRSDNLKLARKDSVLVLFSIVLRNFAMSANFTEYIGRFISSGIVMSIFNLFDPQFDLLMKVEGSAHYIQLFHCLDHLTNFLVFRGQYFKYLHQTNLATPKGPIPRCAISDVVDSKMISPVLDKNKLFELLMRWSLLGLGQESSPDVKEALKAKYVQQTTLFVFGHISRIALSYLTSLSPFFKDSSIFNLNFLNKCSLIASSRQSFIKHLLTHHYDIFLDQYLNAAMFAPLDSASRFMSAISSQFIAPSMRDSMIYTHDTFIKGMSTVTGKDLSDTEKAFIELTYSRVGEIILVGLFFLLHPDLQIRQNAIRMLGQVTSVLCLIHYKCELTVSKKLAMAITKQIEVLPTKITTTRVENAVYLSKVYSKIFEFATEKLLHFAFTVLPKISVSRRDCTRNQLIELIQPWMLCINFDLRKRLVVHNPPKYFIVYSPFSFINELVESFMKIWDPKAPLKHDLQLWKNLSARKNMKFVIIALMDYAINHSESRPFLQSVITYLYRIDPDVILSCVVPFLGFGNWYFQHMQLGKFEEIVDMSDFLANIGKDRKAIKKRNINVDKAIDNYTDSTECVLSFLCSLAREDVIPVTYYFNTIIAFCLTHIELKDSFNLLWTIVATLRNAFNSGIPEALLNAYELFSHISTMNLSQITFICQKTTSPLRSLQDKRVSLSDILEMFINIFPYMPNEIEGEISEMLLCWGVSCGNMRTAATALDLFSTLFETSDLRVLNLIIESISIITRCLIKSEQEKDSTVVSCNYISAAVRALISISKSLIAQQKISGITDIFSIAISLLGVSGPIFEQTINDVLKLIITLIDANVPNIFLLQKTIPDLKELYLTVLKNCKDVRVMFQFAVKILKLPRNILSSNSDFSCYLIPLLPMLWDAVGSPELLTKLCPIRDFFDGIEILLKIFSLPHLTNLVEQVKSGKTTSPQAFSNELMQVLFQSFGGGFFQNAASVLVAFIPLADAISMDAIFDLATAMLGCCQSKQVFKALIPLTREATLNQSLGTFAYQMPYLRTTLCSGNAEHLETLLVSTAAQEFTFKMEWEESFIQIQTNASHRLHLNYEGSQNKEGDVYNVKFDSIDTFPPIFPFVQNFLLTDVADEISNFCRRIQVNPYTKWSQSIYNALDPSEEKAIEGEIEHLELDSEFLSRVSATLEEALASEGSVSSSTLAFEQSISNSLLIQEDNPTEEKEEEVSNNASISFLPSFDDCNSIISQCIQDSGIRGSIRINDLQQFTAYK